MAQRFRQRYLESGDVIDSRDWNLNHAEFIQEWNGYLDRDNLPLSGVTEALIVSSAFNTITGDAILASTNTFDLDLTKVGWQTDDSDGHRAGRVTATVDTDALLIAEWSGWWSWSTDDWSYETHRTAVVDAITGVEDALRLRITVDGTTIADTGWLADMHRDHNAYLVGALPISAGSRVIQVEAQVAAVYQVNSVTNGAGEYTGFPEQLEKALRAVAIQDRELIVTVRKR